MANLTDSGHPRYLRQRLNAVCGPRPYRHGLRHGLPRVLLMSDDRRLPDPGPVLRHLEPGSGVILRHREPWERHGLARALAPACRDRGITFIIAADMDLALDLGADGVHLSEHQVIRPPLLLRHVRARGMMITAAAHDMSAVRRAARIGVTAVLASPVFRTLSHPEKKPLGVLSLAAMCRQSPVPVYALGGVGAETVMRLRHSGVFGIAGIAGIAGIDGIAGTTGRR